MFNDSLRDKEIKRSLPREPKPERYALRVFGGGEYIVTVFCLELELKLKLRRRC